jgi:hypothetical protein
MEPGIFLDKSAVTEDAGVREALGDKFALWKEIGDRASLKHIFRLIDIKLAF